jgi:acetylornithine deacetylase
LSCTELLYELVHIASVSHHEHQISLFVEEKLGQLDMDVTRLGSNLIGKVGHGKPVLMFCGHLDTVPPYFPPSITGTRLYGRGSADDKGGIAAVIDAITHTSKTELCGTLLTLFVTDEELGSQGAQDIIPQVHADFGVVCEPTNLEIVNGHKGRLTFSIESVGKSAHASKPALGENAIVRMANLISAMEEMQLNHHPILGRETITVTGIAAGSAPNVVPDRCRIDVDYRYVPPQDAFSILEMLRARLPEAIIEFADEPKNFTRPFYLPDHEIIKLLKASMCTCGLAPHVVTMDAGTDASRFNEAGIPTVVFGPGGINQAHTSGEWIDLAELENASAVFQQLIMRVLVGEG